MKRTLLIMVQFFFPLTVLLSQEITNIRFEQEGKMINIYYDLTGEGTYDVKVYCSQDGEKTWGNPLIKVTGDVGKDQNTGFGKKMIWDVLAEIDAVQGDIIFKVEALSPDFTGEAGTFIDIRDKKTYKWVKIGEQIWMAENLNYITNSVSWCYDNKSTNCDIYGRLYDWETAKTSCPAGWHLPSDDEWTRLIIILGGKSVAGGEMKETGNSHWNLPNTGATNSSGFTALPGGCCQANGHKFNLVSYTSHFWSSSESKTSRAWTYVLSTFSSNLIRPRSDNHPKGLKKADGYSVRCVKD